MLFAAAKNLARLVELCTHKLNNQHTVLAIIEQTKRGEIIVIQYYDLLLHIIIIYLSGPNLLIIKVFMSTSCILVFANVVWKSKHNHWFRDFKVLDIKIHRYFPP